MEYGSSADLAVLQRAIVEYLDQTSGLTLIKQLCEDYTACPDVRLFHFVIPVEPNDVTDLYPPLGNLILTNPQATSALFQEVVQTAVVTLSWLPKCSSANQITVSFLIRSLPNLPRYHLPSALQLSEFAQYKGYLHYEGIVIAKSMLHKYTTSARFVCSQEDCPGSTGDKFIRLHTAGAREDQTIRGSFKCTFCGGDLMEDSSRRTLADKVVVKLVDPAAFDAPRTKNRFQSITAIIRGDLTEDVTIGEKLRLISQAVVDLSRRRYALEVNNIVRDSDVQVPPALPDSLMSLYEDRAKSPHTLALNLAYAFACEVVPAGTFLNFKLALLLSLTIPSNEQGSADGLDILAVGSDTSLLRSLVQYSATFAQRHILHTSDQCLGASLTKDKQDSGVNMVQGGSLLLAHKGVCVINNIQWLNKSKKHLLFQALEKKRICVDDKSCASGSQLFLPCTCQVWGVMESAHGKEPQSLGDLDSTQSTDGGHKNKLTGALSSVFSLVYHCHVEPASYAEYQIIHHLLLNSLTSPRSNPLIPRQQFQQLLEVVRRVSVTLSAETEQLLTGYFIASRRVYCATTIPPNALNTLTTLAVSHARLCLRTVTVTLDAVMAIYVYDECLATNYGFSPLNAEPLTHMKDNDLSNYIGEKREEMLMQFHQQLKHFLASHGAHTTLTEE